MLLFWNIVKLMAGGGQVVASVRGNNFLHMIFTEGSASNRHNELCLLIKRLFF